MHLGETRGLVQASTCGVLTQYFVDSTASQLKLDWRWARKSGSGDGLRWGLRSSWHMLVHMVQISRFGGEVTQAGHGERAIANSLASPPHDADPVNCMFDLILEPSRLSAQWLPGPERRTGMVVPSVGNPGHPPPILGGICCCILLAGSTRSFRASTAIVCRILPSIAVFRMRNHGADESSKPLSAAR